MRKALDTMLRDYFNSPFICWHYLSSRVGQRIVLPLRNMPVACFRQKKPPTFVGGSLCWHYLSSRAVTRQVLSAQMSLTSVFGMGTGGPSPQSTPTRTKFAGNSVLKNAFSVQTEVWHFPYSVRQSVRNRTPDSDTP